MPDKTAATGPDAGFEVAITHDWLAPLGLRVTTHDPATDRPISENLHRTGIWDGYITRLILDLLRQMPEPVTFYDVGANIGWYSLVVAACLRHDGHAGRVHAFEPGSANRAALSRSLARNGLQDIVDLVPAAVADATGQGVLIRSDDNFGNFRLQSLLNAMPGPAIDRETIPVVALDDWRASGGAALPGLVKMDIQGSEPLALAGFARGLEACEDLTLFLEWEPDVWPLGRSLAPHGDFILYHLDDLNNVLRPVDEAGLLAEFDAWGRRYFDVIAVRGAAAQARMDALLARQGDGTLRFVSGAGGLVERPHRTSRVLETRARAVFQPAKGAAPGQVVQLKGRLFRLFGANRLEIVASDAGGDVVLRQSLAERDHLRLRLPADRGALTLVFTCRGRTGDDGQPPRALLSDLTG